MSTERIKLVDWSYPSSPNAARFKCPQGCWTVSIGPKDRPLEAVKAFPTKAEAMAYAESLPEVWPAWLKQDAIHKPLIARCEITGDWPI